MAMIFSHLSAGNFSTDSTCWMPALLTRMSTRPSSCLPIGDHVGDLLAAQHVGGVVADLDAAAGLELGAGAFDLGRIAQAVQHHVAAPRRHGARQRQADAGGRAGDDRHLTLQVVGVAETGRWLSIAPSFGEDLVRLNMATFPKAQFLL
jgi:hypothetical protein